MESTIAPVRVVFWTDVFGAPFNQNQDRVFGDDCPIPDGMRFADRSAWCTIVPRPEDPENAAALVYHGADYDSRKTVPRISGQPWILWTMESPMTLPWRMEEPGMKNFEYLAAYNLHSRFKSCYFSRNVVSIVNTPLPEDFIEQKTGKSPILWIASNCRATSGRQHYVKQLMKYIEVDSFGECANTAPFPEGKNREELMREYKFYLAIENANCDDYVTEKLYDTIALSTVPIADGPSFYHNFAPTSRSIIRMDAYPDPRDLADYIRYLDRNDTAYLEYFAYRKNVEKVPISDRVDPRFLNVWGSEASYADLWCSVCQGVAPWWKARLDPAYEFRSDEAEYQRVDRSCMAPGKWDYASHGPPFMPNWKPTPTDEFTRPFTNHSHKYLGQVEDHFSWNVQPLFAFVFVLSLCSLCYVVRIAASRHFAKRRQLDSEELHELHDS